ncbi:hypothetical protein HRI_000451300 [Hibiscus trionum]|uniref:Uncharacterized protein n=1 Tax=Hibiscus trionum TaxID=183268 RepID=A0A9W7LLP1_HIBTR|nr:hypothetical protein HRI_000451300 [Hibiscus trionum]
MLDRRHGAAGDPISSFNPAYRIHNNRDGTGDIEFDFWGDRETWYYNNNNNNNSNSDDDDNGSEVEFQVEEARVGNCPSPLWGANKVTDVSPLLPNNHFYSNLSPTRRRQVIEQGRKELMEMVRNMPESSYELSLKDLVDRQNSSEMVKEKVVYEDKSFPLEPETKKTEVVKAGSLSTTATVEAHNFLLKMFFPSFLSFKKKSTAENSSNVSLSPSCAGSKKPADKKWWIKRIFIQRNNRNQEDSSNNSRTSRDVKSSLPGCWLFFVSKKKITKGRNKQADSFEIRGLSNLEMKS